MECENCSLLSGKHLYAFLFPFFVMSMVLSSFFDMLSVTERESDRNGKTTKIKVIEWILLISFVFYVAFRL